MRDSWVDYCFGFPVFLVLDFSLTFTWEKIMRSCSSVGLQLRRTRSTSLGERPDKGFLYDNLTVMGRLGLDDSVGGILVFLLEMQGRLFCQGPSLYAVFFICW